MALVRCTECGYTISDKSSACVHCGCPMETIIAAKKAQKERAAVMEEFYIVGDTLVKYRGMQNVVTIPDTVKAIGRQAFCCRSNLEKVIIPDGVLSIGDQAFDSCFGLREVVMPDSVVEIEKSAFASCASLENIKIPSGVEFIGFKTFFNCRSLKTVEIPKGVMSIGEQAFYNCKSITEAVIPSSVKQMGESAYFGCSSLETVTVGKGITDIEWNTFGGCISLKNIELSSEIRRIAYGAFEGCSSLTDLYYGAGQNEWKLVAVNYIMNTTLKTAKVHFMSRMPRAEKVAAKLAVIADKPAAKAADKAPDSAKTVETPAEKTVLIKKPTKKEFYDEIIDIMPENIKAEQFARGNELTDEAFDAMSEGLFLIPAESAFKFGCMCLLAGRYSWAFRAYLSAAGKGNAFSQYYVGCCFLWGIDTTRKLADAGRWLEKCKSNEAIGEKVAKALAVLDAELEKPENAGIRAKRKK